jgi:gluconokinase
MKIIPKTLVILGVSGCGKSLIGEMLAKTLNGDFEDADDFHPPSNKEKMTNRTPLTDEDRWPWLQVLRERIILHQEKSPCYVLACSALKQSYRDLLRSDDSPEILRFIYLKGTKELIEQRMKQPDREGHFMPIALLDSQFAALEEPQDAIVIDIRLTPNEIVSMILNQFSRVS